MNLADQLNKQFQKRGFPFSATQNPECAIVSLPNGNSVDILIDNMKELDPVFGVMSIIHEYDPKLLNQCNYFDDETFKIKTDLKYDSDLNYTKGCGLDFHVKIGNKPVIYSSVQHETRTTFIQNGVLNHVDMLFDNENELKISHDKLKPQLISMLDSLNHNWDKQKRELQNVSKEMKHIPSDIPFAQEHESNKKCDKNYNGPISMDSINKWIKQNKLPLYYKIEPTNKQEVVLYDESDKIVANYEIIDGHMNTKIVNDLNFINNLYSMEPDLFNKILSINENGSILVWYNKEFVDISHDNKAITLTTTKYNPFYEWDTSFIGSDAVRSTINVTSTIKTNLNNIVQDINNVTNTAKDVSKTSVAIAQPIILRLMSKDTNNNILSNEDLYDLQKDNHLTL